MKKHVIQFSYVAVLSVALAACSANPASPTGPSAAKAGSTAAASDGSTLKATAPGTVSPVNGEAAVSRSPTLVWTNAVTSYQQGFSMSYELELSGAGSVVYTQTVGGSPDSGSHQVAMELPYDTPYFWRIRAVSGASVGPWSGYAEFKTPKNLVAVVPPPASGGGTGYRTPDPVGGARLPRPNNSAQVQAFSTANPSFLRNSCQLDGGNWNFMDGVTDMLRGIDMRYGYNCKRGNCNDPSLDVISYHYGAGPDEGSSQVYCTDLISGHCGSTPGLIWNDVTDVTLSSGTVCKVTAKRPGRSGYPYGPSYTRQRQSD